MDAQRLSVVGSVAVHLFLHVAIARLGGRRRAGSRADVASLLTWSCAQGRAALR